MLDAIVWTVRKVDNGSFRLELAQALGQSATDVNGNVIKVGRLSRMRQARTRARHSLLEIPWDCLEVRISVMFAVGDLCSAAWVVVWNTVLEVSSNPSARNSLQTAPLLPGRRCTVSTTRRSRQCALQLSIAFSHELTSPVEAL